MASNDGPADAYSPVDPVRPDADAGPAGAGADAKTGTVNKSGGKRETGDDRVGIVLGALFWVGIIAAGLFYSNDELRNFVVRWWWAFALPVVVIGVLVALYFLVPPVREWLRSTSATTRAALFSFLVLPFLLAALGAITVLPDEEIRLRILRAVFLVVVCLLPATMWYLFIVTRKASLLNEFLANLDRLGLLDRRTSESDVNRDRRVKSYLQKFEALYGDLPEAIHEDMLKHQVQHYSRGEAGAAVTLSTATVPVALSTVLILIGWVITLPPSQFDLASANGWVGAVEPTVAPFTLAFLGAYFFSLQMLFRRYVLKDLGGTAYVATCIRIVLAAIGVWILIAVGAATAFTHTHLLVAAFVIGVFPRVIWQIVESLFQRIARFALPSMRSELPISDLDGLTVWHEARLEEEDIENVPNMANADLVELLLNTRLPPERIIDWTDKAILYTQLGANAKEKTREKLRTHGILNATCLLSAGNALSRDRREVFQKILIDENGNSVMPTLLASLGTNSNLKLIQHWRDMDGYEQRLDAYIGRDLIDPGASHDQDGQLVPEAPRVIPPGERDIRSEIHVGSP